MGRSLDRSQKLLLAAGATSAVLWALPGFGIVTLPLVYLNTHIHELCHALAAAATGGMAERIVVNANGNGTTLTSGGWDLAISSAGYVGASLIGAFIIAMARNPKGAKSVLTGLAVFLALGMALWVRGGAVGIAAGIGWVVLLLAGAYQLQGATLLFFAQFIGVQQSLTSVLGLYILFKINVQTGLENDALSAQQVSGVPALIWALLWIGISGLGLWAGLRFAWGSNRRAG